MDLAVELDMPVVVLQHELPEGAPVFAVGSPSWSLHPEVERRLRPEFKRASKVYGSAFTGEGVAEWLESKQVDTITIVGYMTNNCDIATAVDAEARGIAAEVLSDASGAIHLANEAGSVSAEQLHDDPDGAPQLELRRRRRHRRVGRRPPAPAPSCPRATWAPRPCRGGPSSTAETSGPSARSGSVGGGHERAGDRLAQGRPASLVVGSRRRAAVKVPLTGDQVPARPMTSA